MRPKNPPNRRTGHLATGHETDAAHPSHPVRVLLVDDLELIRRALRLALDAQDGVAVVGDAEDGATALAMAQRLAPDAVLLDLCMPGPPTVLTVSGLKALRPAPVVLAFSARQDPEAERHALTAGADGYLSKNLTPAELADALKAACAKVRPAPKG